MAPQRRPGRLRPFDRGLASLLRVTDAACVGLMLLVSVQLFDVDWDANYTHAVIISMALFALLAERVGLFYTSWRSSSLSEEIVALSIAWVIVIFCLLIVGYASKTTAQFSRLAIGTWFIGTVLLISTLRAVVRQVLHHYRNRGFNTRNFAVVGDGDLAAHLIQTIKESPWMGLRMTGVFDDRRTRRTPEDPPIDGNLAGTLPQLIEAIVENAVDVVYVTLPISAKNRLENILSQLANTTASVFIIPDFFVFELLGGRWSHIGDIPTVSICETPFFGIDGMVKRIEDLLLSVLIVPSILFPMLLIALAIKLDSPGPVLFRQVRYGLDGRKFQVWKFRSMKALQDGSTVPQATREDPRVTRVGRLIRRYSLDELPQFLNVLTGEMSIVGPRPHAVAHNEYFRSKINGYMLRHKVKPGITGWAQVNGWRGETDHPDKMTKRIDHDLWYIRNWSLPLDLRIVLLTVLSLTRTKDVY